ncbi:MAG: TIGR02206 family membrane protein, partial [Oscillospiraceae bacterium]
MSEWFSNFLIDESDMVDKLNLFGWEHILLLVGTIITAVLMYKYRENLQNWKHKEKFRYVMAGIFFINMISLTFYYIFTGVFDWHMHLPLHFCFITGYLFMYILVSGNKKFFKIIYFFTWIGPLPAMLWPNTPVRFDRYITYQFIISHHILLLMGLYLIFVLGYRVNKIDILKAFAFALCLFIGISIFNNAFGTNYIMTDQLPAHILQMFPFLNYFNYPMLWLLLCGLI